MKKIFIIFIITGLSQGLISCKSKNSSAEEKTHPVSVKTTQILRGDIEKETGFNGSTVYLRRNQVTAPISGFIVAVNVKFGEEVGKDKLLFEMQTRESRALESESHQNDVSVKVSAPSTGYINELNMNDRGAFVSEGAVLCSIVDDNDLMVKVNVPFDYHPVVTPGKDCKIRLTDHSVISGRVSRILPAMDEVNQTQTVLIKPLTNQRLPENLNLIVTFVQETHHNTFLVNRSSLMANETQTEFWVMKVDGKNRAIKMPVQKGIENDSLTEIISPDLQINDQIISEGAYGLPDSTQIRIVK